MISSSANVKCKRSHRAHLQKKASGRFAGGKNLAPTRSRAADLVRLGAVSVDGVKAVKPGMLVAADAGIEVASEALPYVSRGALKLEAALESFGFEAERRWRSTLAPRLGGSRRFCSPAARRKSTP